MQIPQTMDDWNFEIIKEMIDMKIEESDYFDFKLKLNKDIDKIACSFANTDGGFILFGIADLKQIESLKDKNRIVGWSNRKEIKTPFYQQIKNIQPSIQFELNEPPIKIPGSSKVIHVIEILKSTVRPHMVNGRFYKRVNGNKDLMNYREVRKSFYDYEERIYKITKPNLSLVHPPIFNNGFDRPWQHRIINNGDRTTTLIPLNTKISIDGKEIKGEFVPKKDQVLLNPDEVYLFYTYYSLSNFIDSYNYPKNNESHEISLEIEIKYSNETEWEKFVSKIIVEYDDFFKSLQLFKKGPNVPFHIV